MSRVVIQGNASGTGDFTIAAPNSNTNRTLTLPDEAGEILTSSGAVNVDSSAPANSLNIDSSGYVTRPNVPSFRSSLSTQNITASATHTTILWNYYSAASQNLFNNGFTVTDGKFYPPVAGLYIVHCVLRVDLIGSGYITLTVRKNDSTSGSAESYSIVQSPNGTYDFISGHLMAEMTTSDYFNASVYTSSDTNWNVVSTSTFMGYMIG
jgi:hypothetical protein